MESIGISRARCPDPGQIINAECKRDTVLTGLTDLYPEEVEGNL
jgi:hypothetical protein